MRKTRIYELKQTGREQRDTINALEIVIKNLKKATFRSNIKFIL